MAHFHITLVEVFSWCSEYALSNLSTCINISFSKICFIVSFPSHLHICRKKFTAGFSSSYGCHLNFPCSIKIFAVVTVFGGILVFQVNYFEQLNCHDRSLKVFTIENVKEGSRWYVDIYCWWLDNLKCWFFIFIFLDCAFSGSGLIVSDYTL